MGDGRSKAGLTRVLPTTAPLGAAAPEPRQEQHQTTTISLTTTSGETMKPDVVYILVHTNVYTGKPSSSVKQKKHKINGKVI